MLFRSRIHWAPKREMRALTGVEELIKGDFLMVVKSVARVFSMQGNAFPARGLAYAKI